MNPGSSIGRAFSSLTWKHDARPDPTFSQRFHFIDLIRLHKNDDYQRSRAVRGCRYYTQRRRLHDSSRCALCWDRNRGLLVQLGTSESLPIMCCRGLELNHVGRRTFPAVQRRTSTHMHALCCICNPINHASVMHMYVRHLGLTFCYRLLQTPARCQEPRGLGIRSDGESRASC